MDVQHRLQVHLMPIIPHDFGSLIFSFLFIYFFSASIKFGMNAIDMHVNILYVTLLSVCKLVMLG